MMHEKAVMLERTSKLIVVFNLVVFFFVFVSMEIKEFADSNVHAWLYNKESIIWFTASYLMIVLIVLYLVPKKTGIIMYGLYNLFFMLLGLSQILYFKITGTFFGINDLFLVNEGRHYFLFALEELNFGLYIYIIVSLILLVITIAMMSTIDKVKMKYKNYSAVFILIILFMLLRVDVVNKLGESLDTDEFDAWNSPKNIYDNHSNLNRSMQMSGIFEYTFRDICLFIKNRFFHDKLALIRGIKKYLLDNQKIEEPNEYSRSFKDKNLIFIMMESIDDWLITEDTMPTLNYMKKTGINFTNRYAPVFGGGRTFNSEFAANTGLYVPSNGIAIYDYAHNSFPYALPSLFKSSGYTVNSLHFNTGDYYNRRNMHKALGYTNHYALYDMNIKDKITYDSTLASNDEIYKLIVPKKGKFMSFIITYSAHLPYNENSLCNNNGNTLECIKDLSHITDDFFTKLLFRLEQDKKIDDTVIVLFSDHYAYGYDIKYLKKIKGTSDINLLEKIPFIIWSKDIEAKTISTIMDTADIAPTIANMFGLSFDPNNYLGTDVFSNSHEPFVYFNDHSWYDGKIYYRGQKVSGQAEYISNINNKITKMIRVNNSILYTNYYQNSD